MTLDEQLDDLIQDCENLASEGLGPRDTLLEIVHDRAKQLGRPLPLGWWDTEDTVI